MSNQLRLTMVFEFNYYGEVNQESMDRLIERFMADPTNFLSLDALECDERLLVDIELREEDSVTNNS